MTHENGQATFLQDCLDCRNRRSNSPIIENSTILIEWYIEVHTHQHPLMCTLQICYLCGGHAYHSLREGMKGTSSLETPAIISIDTA